MSRLQSGRGLWPGASPPSTPTSTPVSVGRPIPVLTMVALGAVAAPPLIALVPALPIVPAAIPRFGGVAGALLVLGLPLLVLFLLPPGVAAVEKFALGLIDSPIRQGRATAVVGQDLEAVLVGRTVVLDAEQIEDPSEELGAVETIRMADLLRKDLLYFPSGAQYSQQPSKALWL